MSAKLALVALLLSPIALAGMSLLLPWRSASSIAIGALAVAALLAIVNAYLSWIRPLIFRLRTGSCEGLRFVSGIPMVGSVLVTLGVASAPGSRLVAVSTLLLLALDTGGAPWAAIALCRDASFWRMGPSGGER